MLNGEQSDISVLIVKLTCKSNLTQKQELKSNFVPEIKECFRKEI